MRGRGKVGREDITIDHIATVPTTFVRLAYHFPAIVVSRPRCR